MKLKPWPISASVHFVLMAILAFCFVLGCSKDESDGEIKVNEPEGPPPAAPADEDPKEQPAAKAGAAKASPATRKGNAKNGKPDARNVTPREQAQKDDRVAQQNKPKTVSVQRNLLRVDTMLTKKDIRESVPYNDLLVLGSIVGQEPSMTYNSVRWTTGKEGVFGFGLEVWKPGSQTAANKRFNGLYAQSLGGTVTKDVGDRSFRTEHHHLRTITFYDRKRSGVASISCDTSLCTFDELAALARRVQRKL